MSDVGVIGLGFVGGSLKKSFEGRGKNVVAYDKYKEVGSFEDVLSTKVLFLCLPTPYINGHGYDISALIDTCSKLRECGYRGTVVIKSTVEPGVCELLSVTHNLKIVHNPEFLTARTAFEDFDNQSHIVFGMTKSCNDIPSVTMVSYNGEPMPPGIQYLTVLYRDLYPNAEFSYCTAEESESMKIFCNNFYAVKVQVFNEFYLLCQRTGASYEKVKEMMLKNGWINEMHTNVPGPDGSLSYGGLCFPKDTSALKHFMERMGTPSEVIGACVSERNKMRKD